jgi:hypothetical protein
MNLIRGIIRLLINPQEKCGFLYSGTLGTLGTVV